MSTEYGFYDKEKFQKNDIILIPFDDKVPSSYRVLYANNKLKRLRVVVLEELTRSPKSLGPFLTSANQYMKDIGVLDL